jgi:hypothetical protein
VGGRAGRRRVIVACIRSPARPRPSTENICYSWRWSICSKVTGEPFGSVAAVPFGTAERPQ